MLIGEKEEVATVGRYDLSGPQVEPKSAYWTFNGFRFRVIDVDKSLDLERTRAFDPARLKWDFGELLLLQKKRGNGSIEGEDKLPGDPYPRRRERLSRFFRLNPPPLSAIFNISRGVPVTDVLRQCEEKAPFITTPEELARLFEDETPGLLHRHALNCLLFERRVSPTRQARVWAALDITIYSALLAAWRHKWAISQNGQPDYTRSYIQRPSEYARDTNDQMFKVLYDRQVQPDGSGSQADDLCDDLFSPGTPRHPAYPSGHSTYSSAASELMAYFFPDQRAELERLADNIGMARIWAGVHWRQDHELGVTIGKAVAEQVIQQLRQDPVAPVMTADRCDETIPAPDFVKLRTAAQNERSARVPANQDAIPPPDRSVQEIRGPNRGGGPVF